MKDEDDYSQVNSLCQDTQGKEKREKTKTKFPESEGGLPQHEIFDEILTKHDLLCILHYVEISWKSRNNFGPICNNF